LALKTFLRAAAAAILLATAGAAAAQPEPKALEVKADAPFRHAHTRLELPPRVGGIVRSRVAELEADQLDTIVDYAAPDLSSAYTFYVYRNVSGALPVWFDRASWMIEHRGALGTATPHGKAGAFVPPGRVEAAGLIATYDLTGKDFRSTGVAMVPLGEWYVKLRASSKTLPADDLEARMKAALAELRWPKTMPAAASAVPVERCASALALRGEAKLLEGGDKAGASTLMNAFLGMAVADAAKKKGVAAPVRTTIWCQDAAQALQAGVYRADGATNSYLLALSDAGRAIWAGPDPGQSVLVQIDPKAKADKPSFVVELLLLPRTLTTRAYDRLPTPNQALAIVKEGHFASAVPTWGAAKGHIQVSADALK
jgi:hypothetical protein